MRISVIGLGKLGLCTAGCFASKGNRVFGFDLNASLMRSLRGREIPIDETGLGDLLSSAWESLELVDSIGQAVMESEATLVIVPTPSGPDGRFSNRFVVDVLREIGQALRDKEGFHIVDVVSTVMPGSCEREFIPLLEGASGKRCGTDFGLVYNPEFIALGSVIRDFLHPDLVLIGASDKFSGERIAQLYGSMVESSPRFETMSLVNAEIAKLSLNCFVTMKISFANGLADACERVRGADVDVVTRAIGADSRVGSKYLLGGMGFGGPCFPRDNLAFQRFAQEAGTDALIGKAVVEVNNRTVDRIESLVRQVETGSTVALLGMSYKPGTRVVEESQSIELASRLSAGGYRVRVFDPKAMESAKSVLGGAVEFCADATICTQGAAAIVLLTDWPDWGRLDWEGIRERAADDCLLVDCWRRMDNSWRGLFRYRALGLGPSA